MSISTKKRWKALSFINQHMNPCFFYWLADFSSKRTLSPTTWLKMTKKDYLDKIIHGDCEKVLQDFPDNSIDLIFTSPPYADQRVKTYGGIKPDQYVKWFLPKAAQFKRVLKPTGTFILNIKERVVDGERHTYVLDLILRMREQGWLWTEEYIWHKKNSYPGKWPNRFRDNWERLIQFNKEKNFSMYQETVMVPVGDWAKDLFLIPNL